MQQIKKTAKKIVEAGPDYQGPVDALVDKRPTSNIYEINVNGKYLLTFDPPITPEDMRRGQQYINEWAGSPHPILILPGGAKLVKVEDV